MHQAGFSERNVIGSVTTAKDSEGLTFPERLARECRTTTFYIQTVFLKWLADIYDGEFYWHAVLLRTQTALQLLERALIVAKTSPRKTVRCCLSLQQQVRPVCTHLTQPTRPGPHPRQLQSIRMDPCCILPRPPGTTRTRVPLPQHWVCHRAWLLSQCAHHPRNERGLDNGRSYR